MTRRVDTSESCASFSARYSGTNSSTSSSSVQCLGGVSYRSGRSSASRWWCRQVLWRSPTRRGSRRRRPTRRVFIARSSKVETCSAMSLVACRSVSAAERRSMLSSMSRARMSRSSVRRVAPYTTRHSTDQHVVNIVSIQRIDQRQQVRFSRRRHGYWPPAPDTALGPHQHHRHTRDREIPHQHPPSAVPDADRPARRATSAPRRRGSRRSISSEWG